MANKPIGLKIPFRLGQNGYFETNDVLYGE